MHPQVAWYMTPADKAAADDYAAPELAKLPQAVAGAPVRPRTKIVQGSRWGERRQAVHPYAWRTWLLGTGRQNRYAYARDEMWS